MRLLNLWFVIGACAARPAHAGWFSWLPSFVDETTTTEPVESTIEGIAWIQVDNEQTSVPKGFLMAHDKGGHLWWGLAQDGHTRGEIDTPAGKGVTDEGEVTLYHGPPHGWRRSNDTKGTGTEDANLMEDIAKGKNVNATHSDVTELLKGDQNRLRRRPRHRRPSKDSQGGRSPSPESAYRRDGLSPFDEPFSPRREGPPPFFESPRHRREGPLPFDEPSSFLVPHPHITSGRPYLEHFEDEVVMVRRAPLPGGVLEAPWDRRSNAPPHSHSRDPRRPRPPRRPQSNGALRYEPDANDAEVDVDFAGPEYRSPIQPLDAHDAGVDVDFAGPEYRSLLNPRRRHRKSFSPSIGTDDDDRDKFVAKREWLEGSRRRNAYGPRVDLPYPDRSSYRRQPFSEKFDKY